MPAKTSAGVLPYRVRDGVLEVLVGHMGGPFWARKDEGAWSILKGEYDAEQETPLDAARREFAEESGATAPEDVTELGEVRQSAKRVTAFAAAMPELDPETLTSNTFSMPWPPRSGRTQEFPEIDRMAWLDAETAKAKLVKAQRAFVERLEAALPGSKPDR